jgi:four helix bundle protein
LLRWWQFEAVAPGMGSALQDVMAGVRDHRELHAWQLADAVRTEVRELTARPEFRANIELRTQLRRSSESACANIAEGFSRYYPRDFARFLRIAKGSLSETIEHVSTAADSGLISLNDAVRINSLARRARGACTQLIRYLETAALPGSSPRHPTESRRPERQWPTKKTADPDPDP